MIANPLSSKDTVAALIMLRLAAVVDAAVANALYASLAKMIPAGYCLRGIAGNQLVFSMVEAEPKPARCDRRWHASPCTCAKGDE
jgi:hypothetical protein